MGKDLQGERRTWVRAVLDAHHDTWPCALTYLPTPEAGNRSTISLFFGHSTLDWLICRTTKVGGCRGGVRNTTDVA